MAPNAITLVGHALALSSVLVIAAAGPAHPRGAALCAAALIFLYCVADSIDGMQARRIGAASPLGDFLDHGLDALPGFLLPLTALAAYGGTTAQEIALVISFAVGWWGNNLARLRTGILVLPPLGAMEANFLLIAVHLATALAGRAIWHANVGGLTPLDLLFAVGVVGFLDAARASLRPAGRRALRIVGMLTPLGLIAAWWAMAGERSALPPIIVPVAMGLLAAACNGELLRHILLGTRWRVWDGAPAALALALAASAALGETATGDALFVLLLALLIGKLSFQLFHTARFATRALGIGLLILAPAERRCA